MTTFRIPVIVLALAASLGASVSLGNPSTTVNDAGFSASQPAAAAPDRRPDECRIASAFPTAEAGFALRRPDIDRIR